MTEDIIRKCAEANVPFFGKFWDTFIIKITNYKVTDDNGLCLVYCSGHGCYDWYHVKDYGRTWAFHLCELREDIVDERISEKINEIPKTKEIGELNFQIKHNPGTADYTVGYRNGIRYAIELLGGSPTYEERPSFGLAEYRSALVHAITDNSLEEYTADNPLVSAEDIERFISDIAKDIFVDCINKGVKE